MTPFHEPVDVWFRDTLGTPTRVQSLGWPVIQRGESVLMLAPTGSGKTLAAFLAAIDHIMFEPVPARDRRCRVLYLSPLKALAVDIERNLRVPISGVSATAARLGMTVHAPEIAVRTGDTPAQERASFGRRPADILITTPESLYLVLTSKAREALRSVRYVIVDEIHAMLPTKRGVHLALSLERLQALVTHPMQRIGLSATVRPLEEAARFLGGGEIKDALWTPRPVTIVDAGAAKALDITVEVPMDDMSAIGRADKAGANGGVGKPIGSKEGAKRPKDSDANKKSIWPSIHPRLLELIRQHRTTLIFVNNRRLAERLAAAINELAGEEIVRSHHGSVAREQRLMIEEALKAGRLPAIVATSSLELGIDMGSIDLVIQIEAAPSVAAGLQRIGRAGHQIGVPSKGLIFPKYRGDLLACAALTSQMLRGEVEPQRYSRNALDVLAQQIVAMVSLEPWTHERLHQVVRGAAPFADLSANMLDNVLDMLTGRYPSTDFAGLKPRLVWDRMSNTLRAREGAWQIAITNGGTIPDRGLFGVFISGADSRQGRVGELDEEMVFESRVGERFLLGATTWRIDDITPQRVLVSPAPGEPGKMPFWKGDAAGRPMETGRAIGALTRRLRQMERAEAVNLLQKEHRLDERAARNLLAYLDEQMNAVGSVPDDRTILLERYIDDLGDWRLCILSPFGARVHAPWTQAILGLIRAEKNLDVEALWSDDGIVIRLPEADEPPAMNLIFPSVEDIEDLVVREMAASAMFASRFREAASRALLLPRRYPGQRTPLWQQRKRAADLLALISDYRDFPIVLEVFRELLRDVYDMPGLIELLREIQSRVIRVVTVDTRTPSPFASSLMFGYVGNFIYDGDAPLAERRAQALSIDQSQLRELLGETELRELLDPEIVESLELQLQRLDPSHRVKTTDAVHDLLLSLGDLTEQEIRVRAANRRSISDWLEELRKEKRAVNITVARDSRWIAAEDLSRYRDAFGVSPPPGMPRAFLQDVADPLGDIIGRFARTHGPFTTEEIARRLALAPGVVRRRLRQLEMNGRVLEGEFRPGGAGREWCDTNVLRTIRQRSLARLRHQVEPVEHTVYGRFLPAWHRVGEDREGPEALLEAIGQIQGYAAPASVLEDQILRTRVKNYDPRDLDSLLSSGLVTWTGVERLGPSDGRVALYLTGDAAQLMSGPVGELKEKEIHHRIRDYLGSAGASFFPQIVAGTGGGFRGETLNALWDLVWSGEVTNDTFMALRALLQHKEDDRRRRLERAKNPVAPTIAPEAAGRWSLLSKMFAPPPAAAARLTAIARQLLDRLGVVAREAVAGERIPGGFSSLYPVLKAMEEAGHIRRGYFIAGRGAAQFANPGALERLRQFTHPADEPGVVMLAATDPANPYGSALPWPERKDNRQVGRFAGAQVILVDGTLAAYFSKSERSLLTFFDPNAPGAQRQAEGVVRALSGLVSSGLRRALLITQVDGLNPAESALASALRHGGFRAGTHGWQRRREG
jgi:ATP-dependent Lhr-like helicase